MKILNEFPPNYEDIKKTFPEMEVMKPVFCYEDNIYNPFNVRITPDLQVHEEVHSKQQGFNPADWWQRYLNDKEFRTDQEIMAYGTQLFFVSQSDIPKKRLEEYANSLAEQLSSGLYGSVLSFGEAKSKIKRACKNLMKIKNEKAKNQF